MKNLGGKLFYFFSLFLPKVGGKFIKVGGKFTKVGGKFIVISCFQLVSRIGVKFFFFGGGGK